MFVSPQPQIVHSFLQRVASQIPTQKVQAPVIVHHYHHCDPWYYPSQSSCFNNRDSDSDDDRDDDKVAIIIGIASIIFGAGLFFYKHTDFFTSKSNYQQTCEVLKSNFSNPEIKILATNQMPIDKNNYCKDRNYILSSLGFLGSGSLLSYGGYSSSINTVNLGLFGLIFSIGFAITNFFYHFDDNNYYANTIQNNARKAQALLKC